MKILIIEDNVALSNNIKEYLKLNGIKAETDFDGQRGMEKIIDNHYDLLILDINLPGKDGLSICEELRKRGNEIPILMLTSRNAKKDIVVGLDIGADDYLGKPFDLEELLSRIQALYRRTSTNKSNIINIHDIEVDVKKRTVKKGENYIDFSTLEFDLLKYLVLNRGVPVDRKSLFENVWGEFDSYMFSRTVDVYIGYVRKKIGNDFIKTVKGFGYLIE